MRRPLLVVALCSSLSLAAFGCASDAAALKAPAADAAPPESEAPAPHRAPEAAASQPGSGELPVDDAAASPQRKEAPPAIVLPALTGSATDRAQQAVSALADGCEVKVGQPGRPDQGLFLASCRDRSLMFAVVGSEVTNPKVANVDVMLGALMADVDDLPPPQMRKLALGSRQAVPVVVIEPPSGDAEVGLIYLLEHHLQPDTRMVLCGFQKDATFEGHCRAFLGAFID